MVKLDIYILGILYPELDFYQKYIEDPNPLKNAYIHTCIFIWQYIFKIPVYVPFLL